MPPVVIPGIPIGGTKANAPDTNPLTTDIPRMRCVE